MVFRTGFLGDVLVSMPAFWSIRDNFPDARITLLTNSDRDDSRLITARQILPEKGIFDNYLDYYVGSKRWVNKFEIVKLFMKLRSKQFDCLIYLMNRNRSIAEIKRDEFFFRICGIDKIIGIEHLKKSLVNYNSSKPLPTVEPEFEFLTNCLLDNIEFTGLKISQKTGLLLSDKENEFCENWIKNNYETIAGRKIVALAPGSKWESKVWGAEKYLRVLERLTAEFDVFPIVFGGREDFQTGEYIIGKLGTGINAANLFSIRQSAGVLKYCTFYLGNDTGTMHLAASAGVRCLAIFSAVDFPNRWIPAGKNHVVMRKQVVCEGCHSADCFNQKLCTDLISVEEVLENCRQILS